MRCKITLIFLTFLTISLLPACKSGCQNAGAEKHYKELTGLSLEDLDSEQKDGLLQIANEEVCPCDCPKSFAACLQKDSGCKPALILGQWAADKLRSGVSIEDVSELVSKEISAGFAAKPAKIDTQGYHFRGAEKPSVSIVEFADFECVHCKEASQSLHDLAEKYPKQVQVIFKHFPLPGHKMATAAAIAAEAAGEQSKFWAMHDAAFATQNMLSDDLIDGHAKAIGLDFGKFQKDKTNPLIVAKVEKSKKDAEALGLQGTPAIFFNGRPLQLPFDMTAFETRLAMEETRTTASCN